MKRTTVAAMIAAGALALTACGGTGSDAEGEAAPQDGGAAEQSAAAEPAEEAPAEAKAPTSEELSAAIEAAGYTLEDTPDASEAAGAMEGVTIEPEQCRAFMDAALALHEESVVDQAMGTKTEGQTMHAASAIVFPDAAAAGRFVSNLDKQAKACADMTMTVQGQSIEMTLEANPVDVDGADDSVATTAGGDMMGIPIEVTQVYGSKGAVVVSSMATDMSGSGESASAEELAPHAAAVIAELP